MNRDNDGLGAEPSIQHAMAAIQRELGPNIVFEMLPPEDHRRHHNPQPDGNSCGFRGLLTMLLLAKKMPNIFSSQHVENYRGKFALALLLGDLNLVLGTDLLPPPPANDPPPPPPPQLRQPLSSSPPSSAKIPPYARGVPDPCAFV